nr:MAG TPA: hypothetical protein [Caudoviricetes sp.]DAZ25364.1 MAG TPA: hypothetical protein [Caudoviricetes sp.]
MCKGTEKLYGKLFNSHYLAIKPTKNLQTLFYYLIFSEKSNCFRIKAC